MQKNVKKAKKSNLNYAKKFNKNAKSQKGIFHSIGATIGTR